MGNSKTDDARTVSVPATQMACDWDIDKKSRDGRVAGPASARRRRPDHPGTGTIRNALLLQGSGPEILFDGRNSRQLARHRENAGAGERAASGPAGVLFQKSQSRLFQFPRSLVPGA